jgi:5-methylcytosine-specific restriction protein B
MTALASLALNIMNGLPDREVRSDYETEVRNQIKGIFGERYQAKSPYSMRVVLNAPDDTNPFAGFVHENSPPSGVYGGMSLIWFPLPVTDVASTAPLSLLTFVCGTRGLSPDEHIIGRPGHLRHLRALQRYLAKEHNINSWVKPDPTNLSEAVPKTVQSTFQRFDAVLKRYGSHIYMCAEVPKDMEKAMNLLHAFFDLYAWERGWQPLAGYKAQIEEFKTDLRSYIFPKVEKSQIVALLKQRRFVILQGPPGTGKTRMAMEIAKTDFAEEGFSVQFHPAVSYETFVAGISPKVDGGDLNFQVKPGWLMQAIQNCKSKPYLLHIDEINRADLSRVLGEAIYLFEPRDIGDGNPRAITLPHAMEDGQRTFSMPENLYILGTMNTADRSIAIMDMAVRRRFAFVDVWPDIDVVAEQGLVLATEAFALLQDIFSQFASEDSFRLMPGHSYFLAETKDELISRFKYELIPLLREYLQEGRLANCETELRSYIDWLENRL